MGDATTTPATDTAKQAATPTPMPSAAVASAAPAAAPVAADPVDDLVDQWMKGQINDSPLSRDVDSYNHLRASLPALKQAIRGL
jgi:hypothetical protein